jgi:hypothetical protein
MNFKAEQTLKENEGFDETLMAGALQAIATIAILEHAAFAQHTPTAETLNAYLQTRGNEIAGKLLNEKTDYSKSQSVKAQDAIHCVRRCAGMMVKLADALERKPDDDR